MGAATSEAPVPDVRAPAVGIENGAQGRRKSSEVAVVDAAVLQLVRELVKQPGPVPARGRGWDATLDQSLDHLHCGPAGGRGPCLLPGPMPAGGQALLGDRPAASRSDGPTAPAAGRRRSPASSIISTGVGRRRASLLALCALGLLAPLLLPLPTSSPVAGASAISHAHDSADEPAVTRHHELRNPWVHEVCRLVILISPGSRNTTWRRSDAPERGGALPRPLQQRARDRDESRETADVAGCSPAQTILWRTRRTPRM